MIYVATQIYKDFLSASLFSNIQYLQVSSYPRRCLVSKEESFFSLQLTFIESSTSIQSLHSTQLTTVNRDIHLPPSGPSLFGISCSCTPQTLPEYTFHSPCGSHGPRGHHSHAHTHPSDPPRGHSSHGPRPPEGHTHDHTPLTFSEYTSHGPHGTHIYASTPQTLPENNLVTAHRRTHAHMPLTRPENTLITAHTEAHAHTAPGPHCQRPVYPRYI